MAEVPKNDHDLLRMQQEAIRRVRMMQQRAQRSVESESGGHARREPPPAERARPSAPDPERTPHARPSPPQRGRPRYAARPQQNPLAALFGHSRGKEDSLLGALFDGDSERTLLIVLLMILIDDQSDLSLILALLYLIL